MPIKYLLALGALFLCGMTAVHAKPSEVTPSPSAEMEKTVDSIIEIANAFSAKEQRDVRRAKLRDLINPKFNFAEMAKRSLGPNWKALTPEERSEFTEVFSELLARTYLSKIETVKPGMVKVKGEQVRIPRAIVKTIVISKGDKFPINYKMALKDNVWQVYDVVIENIGLVANYRNEFSGIIRKEEFSGLMERLRKKVS
jgi:phospholipid transport system substrate-binding protein